MPVAVGLDAAGQATPALLKKLAVAGRRRRRPCPACKRARWTARPRRCSTTARAKGATLAEGLQKALAEAIAKLPIPKVMSYQLESGCELPGWTSVSFVRPAHGLVALHGDDVVPVEALGLQAGRETHGHRFEAAVDPVVLRDADSYARAAGRRGRRDRRLRGAPRRDRAPAGRGGAAGRRRRAADRRRRAARRSDRAGRAPQRAGLRIRARVPRRAAGMPDPHDEGQPEVLPAARRRRQADATSSWWSATSAPTMPAR